MKMCIALPTMSSYSETFLLNFIRELKPEKVVYGGLYPNREKNEGAIIPFPFNSDTIKNKIEEFFPGFTHNLYSKKLSNYLKSSQIDMVFAQYGPMGVSLADACKLAKVDLVVHFHGADAYQNETLERYSSSYKDMFRQASAIIGVSQDMCKQLVSLGAQPDKVFNNACGVNISNFFGGNPQSSAIHFVAVGRFVAKKDPFSTLYAFSKVFKVYKDAKLTMVGDGKLWEEAIELANKLGINSVVNFVGPKEPNEIIEILRTARAFVQHSRRAQDGDCEGTPVAILEAASMGLPVVSTLHAGIKDAVVHGQTGFLVPEGDVEAMANYMILLAQDAVLADKMGQSARKHIETNYEMQKQINKLKNILGLCSRELGTSKSSKPVPSSN